ncbi:MAG: hypothetical protein RIG82_08915 [Phycisphaeraceae bacterium]
MKQTMPACVLGCLMAAPVWGESALPAVLMPYPPEKTVLVDVQSIGVFGSDVERTGTGVGLAINDIDVRGRLWSEGVGDEATPDTRAALRLRLHTLTIESSDPVFPEGLMDLFVGGGMTHQLDESDWSVSWALGVGYAGQVRDNDGDLSFDGEDGWYGSAGVAATHQVDERTSYTVLLDWNGNRSVFPDIPLPGFIYTQRLDVETPLIVSFGFPYAAVSWQPMDRLTVEGTWFFPESVEAMVTYEVHERFDVYVSLTGQAEAYATKALPEDRRMFFEQDRAELGFSWKANPDIELGAAVGYAFNQEFSTGFDRRDDTTLRKLDDAPYLGLHARFAF